MPSHLCFPPWQFDETLMERLWGLTEMFPDTVRNVADASAHCSVSLVKKLYRYVLSDSLTRLCTSVTEQHGAQLTCMLACRLFNPHVYDV